MVVLTNSKSYSPSWHKISLAQKTRAFPLSAYINRSRIGLINDLVEYDMEQDKYQALWLSHTKIKNYQNCPRAYYLNHIYRNPETGNKIVLMKPVLALGQTVHQVLEEISKIPKDDRFKKSLLARYKTAWEKVSGKKGGFFSQEVENQYRRQGEEMLETVSENPGPLKRLAVKIEMDLPHFWLSKKDNFILCGKIDWLEYLPESDSVHIIDFKTGKSKNEEDSLQLTIYKLLVENCQTWPVEKASYWYLKYNKIEEKKLPSIEDGKKEIMKIGQKIKLGQQLNKSTCPEGEQGCRYCQSLERIVNGEGELVGQDDYGNDIFVLPKEVTTRKKAKIL